MVVNRSIRVLIFCSLCCLTAGCFSSGPDGFGTVHGVVTVNSKPAPDGTRLRFQHAEDASCMFVAIINDAGHYSYAPPTQAPLKQGAYKVAYDPVTSTTQVDSTGLAVEVVSSGAAKGYGDYTDLKKSGLTATLTDGSVEFSFDIPRK